MNKLKLFIILLPLVMSTEKRALQKSHEKSQWVKWSDAFLGQNKFDQQAYLVKLLKKIAEQYLQGCTTVILYDVFTELHDNLILQKLLAGFPTAYIHSQITENYKTSFKASAEDHSQNTCLSYILFIRDVMKVKDIIGDRSHNKIIIVAKSSQWRVLDFLSRQESQFFVNLLVIVKSEDVGGRFVEAPYILYTHDLYIDALGSSKPVVLTSYQKNKFTRNVNLFPRKISRGFAGHRFIVALAQQPPYIIMRGRNSESDTIFEGIEFRLMELLGTLYNFTLDYREATENTKIGSTEAVVKTIEKGNANLGIGGIYMTTNKIRRVGFTQWHSQDCAAFISLSSTALPRYRAIMGPFHWTVWLAITAIYLIGIFPLVFSEKQTLRQLLNNPEEIENMFWYVFGTFTNCFSFSGSKTWNKADKLTTKILIGFYWIFTIIVTACYTGSIIAFVTLPIYPEVVDSVKQLLDGRYRIGTLNKGEWRYLFLNSSDPYAEKLLVNLDLVSDIESGLKNVSKSFFWKYAFLGSRAQLDYLVRTNFTTESKRSVMHISKECFVPFNVAITFPLHAIYGKTINDGLNLVIQSGILKKLKSDVEWQTMRSATGKLLAANSKIGSLKSLSYEDRSLTLDDTQGMFLLLGAGFLIATFAVLSEFFGGCLNIFTRKRQDSVSTIASNPRTHERQTPRDWQSVQYFRRCSNHTAEVHQPNNVAKVLDDSPDTNIPVAFQVEENNASKDVDKVFERVFGQKCNHYESDDDNISSI